MASPVSAMPEGACARLPKSLPASEAASITHERTAEVGQAQKTT